MDQKYKFYAQKRENPSNRNHEVPLFTPFHFKITKHSDFLKDIEKTEPYQIVYEIERLHEDGKRLELA
jgi:hypothetical protein